MESEPILRIMNKRRLKQFGSSFLIVLSLLVSSVAASCICAHHAEPVEVETSSCHEQATAEPATNAIENASRLDSNEDCGCIQPAPRIISKSETIKLEKQAAVLPFAKIEIKPAAPLAARETVRHFEKPFYLSDSFYNLKSPRAPPRA